MNVTSCACDFCAQLSLVALISPKKVMRRIEMRNFVFISFGGCVGSEEAVRTAYELINGNF